MKPSRELVRPNVALLPLCFSGKERNNVNSILIRRAFLEALVPLFYCAIASAQTTGVLRGTVKDPSGAVVPGARVAAAL